MSKKACIQVVRCRWNRISWPILILGPKPVLTEFSIHHRLESCESWHENVLNNVILMIYWPSRWFDVFPEFCPTPWQGYVSGLQILFGGKLPSFFYGNFSFYLRNFLCDLLFNLWPLFSADWPGTYWNRLSLRGFCPHQNKSALVSRYSLYRLAFIRCLSLVSSF